MTTERFARASRDNCLRSPAVTSGPYRRRTPPFWPVALVVGACVFGLVALAYKFGGPA